MDLNLMRPLCVLLEERHVSHAAERCGMTQPAMSRILERLRSTLDDELIIRTGRRYERTPRGEQLLTQLRDILDRLDTTIAGDQFLPERCDATFRVATTDYFGIVFVPRLLRDLELRAPGASLDISVWDDRSFDDINAGRLDAAVLALDTSPPATLRSEKLFEEEYVCMVAVDHPLRGRQISLATYLSHRHVVIDVQRGSQPTIDLSLARRDARRRVGYRTPFLHAAILAAAATSMIVTVPRRLADSYATMIPVRILAAPSELKGFSYSLVWHKRLESSAANAWFRDRVRIAAADVFSELEPRGKKTSP